MEEQIKWYLESGNLCKGIDKFTVEFDELKDIYSNSGAVYLDSLPRGSFDTPVSHLSSFTVQSFNAWNGTMEQLSEDIKPLYDKKYTICIMAGTSRACKALQYDLNEAGFDAVYFEKKAVKVSLAEKMFSGIYSRMMRKYAVKEFESGGINSIMMNQKVLKTLNGNIEANSSVVLQILNSGFKHTTITLEYLARSGGKSKWTLSKKIKLFIDSFVAFSYMPIRLVSIVGILMLIIGFAAGIFTIVNKILNPLTPAGYSTFVCVLVMGFGITNISLGIIAEYIWRILDAVRDRPVFVISEIYNITGGKN